MPLTLIPDIVTISVRDVPPPFVVIVTVIVVASTTMVTAVTSSPTDSVTVAVPGPGLTASNSKLVGAVSIKVCTQPHCVISSFAVSVITISPRV
ncbi:MAG: hypothetical protein JKY18_04180 [Flavobacteriales bacterium]|nr:hypothetical protein [Flavobacteriales bacterium]